MDDLTERFVSASHLRNSSWNKVNARELKWEITTKDSHRFQKRVDSPHGLDDDPLTDGELEDKFREMATKSMGKEQIKKILATIWNVERLDDISKLTRLMVFSPQ